MVYGLGFGRTSGFGVTRLVGKERCVTDTHVKHVCNALTLESGVQRTIRTHSTHTHERTPWTDAHERPTHT